MARFSHPNILKLGKSKLFVNVRELRYYDHRLPCPSNCSASPFHITFHTHSTHRFLDPRRVSLSSLNSSALIGEHQKVVGNKTICQDGSLFFKFQEKANSWAAVKSALRFLKVKKSLYGKIFKKVMAFGRRYNKRKPRYDNIFKKVRAFGRRYNNKSNEKKVLRGLVVRITTEQSFIGDRDLVHEVLEKSWEESKSRARGDGNILHIVN